MRRGIRRDLSVNDNGDPRSRVKLCRLVGDVVVDRVVDAVGARVPDRQLVHQDPLVDGIDLGYDGHSRASELFVVPDIIDDGTPGAEVLGPLMGEFLSMLGVPLVRVVDYELVLVFQEEGFPDRRGAVGCVRTAALGYVADELPGARLVGAGVQVDAGAVFAPAVSREEMVPALNPPSGFCSSSRAGCALMPQPLTWSVMLEIHFQ